MIKGVHWVCYRVKDLGRSIEFYADVLNMQNIYESQSWACMEAWGTTVALFCYELSGDELYTQNKFSLGGTLVLASDDITSDRERLEALGVNISEAVSNPWGLTLAFRDPDGNVLNLYQDRSNEVLT